MRVVFLGDISVAEAHSYQLDELEFLRDADRVIANLEGPILPASEIERIQSAGQRVLYNSPAVIDLLQRFEVDVVCLANNHIFDHGDSLAYTKEVLRDAGIGYFGAGDNLLEASGPCLLAGEDPGIKLFGFGWDVIGCRYAGRDRPGVNPLEPGQCLGTIRELRKTDAETRVIYYFHWNYELESYPQPADRQLAKQLIEEGVDVIIGNHPHLAQGGERCQGKPILYSLGNWFFPPRKFGPVSLNFSPQPTRQMAVEIDLSEAEALPVSFHWLRFDSEAEKLVYEARESWDGETLARLTPFSGISEAEYIAWFKAHRKKGRGLPVYRDYRLPVENWIKDQFVKLRQQLIWLLVKTRIKK